MDGILFKLFYQVFCVILLANGEGCKDMVFKVTFEGKTLANHVFKTIRSVNDGHCQLQCFLDDRCISYSFGTSASGEKYMCELSDSDHIMYPEDLVDRPDVIYRSAQNTCSCTKNMACRMNFVDGTHRCECKPGFQGVNCAANYTKIGCFQDADGTPNPFPRIIVNLRPEINWNDIKTSVVDKCANAAKTMGYKYFGIQFYGECWSGPDDKIDYDKDGPSQECSNGVGKEDTNFVYKLV